MSLPVVIIRTNRRARLGDATVRIYSALRGNIHPTVKPTNLMRWLVRLVTPAGGTVLDPFLGSGSTGRAAVLEGMRFIGIEKDTEHGYVAIAEARIADAIRERDEELRDRAHAQVDLFAAEVPA